jgi:hypothetical protein
MLSTATRLRLQEIADRISSHEPVSFEEMMLIQKHADHNTSAAEILRKARRKAMLGKESEGSLDSFLADMDLGFEDPSDHLTGPQDPEDLLNWFKRKPTDDWRRRD